ncbi:SAM-dependent methyltransferase [Sphaerisporangium flaviroseum]|uniref:SAM-dependent methyltransferase n=1 Tax=Sphaerisporangium flaviroseum TaxID=509199 RepID=UPI0031EE7667
MKAERHINAERDADAPRYAPEWLALREAADAAARAPELLDPLRAYLAAVAPSGGPVIRDLGCGTGAMGRWLSGRLPGPQRWILHDQDPELLAHAAAGAYGPAADGGPVTAEAEQGDVTRLRAEELAGTSLLTASALLDLLTAEEVDELAEACAGARCPALLTISVLGRVELDPADPLDSEIAAAFDAHQRRVTGGRRLLGPDAVEVAAAAFARRGAVVHTRPSPWRLGADQAALTAEWLRGWVGAACEQRPDLTAHAQDYLRRRLDTCAAGGLRVVVHHDDLLALPSPAAGGCR